MNILKEGMFGIEEGQGSHDFSGNNTNIELHTTLCPVTYRIRNGPDVILAYWLKMLYHKVPTKIAALVISILT